MQARRPTIGIVAGEASGDLLGAGLIRAVRARLPEARFVGVAGPKMEAAGCEVWASVDRLAVMGIVEVLGRLPDLLALRRSLARRFLAAPPDLFVGVDAPDFNLTLERRLHRAGIPTLHYVSPSVWAWRQRRAKTIARSVDRILTLFPFEAAFYDRHHVPATYVGHPLADAMPLEPDRTGARRALALPEAGEVLAILPGSRGFEVAFLAERFLAAARWLLERRPGLKLVVPLASRKARALVEAALGRLGGELPVTLVDGRAREVLTAADLVLVASGTAALEAMLAKRPMVVAYGGSRLSYWIIKPQLRVSYYSLPNHLLGRKEVPELIQDDVRPEALGRALLRYLEEPEEVARLVGLFTEAHRTLARGADGRAAEAVMGMLSAGRQA